MAYFNYNRRKSSVAQIGDTPMGGENPIRIQSMANVSTMDTEAAVAQAIRMIEAGAEYVRFTAQGEREARNLGEIRKQLNEQGYTTLISILILERLMPPPVRWKRYVSIRETM